MFTPSPAVVFRGLVFFLLPCIVLSDIVNRTIDDTFGDSATGQLVTYFPDTAEGPWATPSCPVCAIKPDVRQAFKQTYRAATWYPTNDTTSITMQFNGVAIYVFFILVNNAGNNIVTFTAADFALDGGEPELFQHTPDLSNSDILYNQLVFNRENLDNTQHTLVISMSHPAEPVYVNFDYAIYTHQDDVQAQFSNIPNTPSSNTPSLNTPPASNPSPSPIPATTSPGPQGKSGSGAVTAETTITSGFATLTVQTTFFLSETPTPSHSTLSGTGISQQLSTSRQRSVKMAPIAGSIAGVVVLAMMTICVVIWLRRRRRRDQLEKPIYFSTQTQASPENGVRVSAILYDSPTASPISRKYEEIKRAQQLVANNLSSARDSDGTPISSESSPITQSRSILYVSDHGEEIERGNAIENGDHNGGPTQDGVRRPEVAIQALSLRAPQRVQSSSTERLLKQTAPPPEYEA